MQISVDVPDGGSGVWCVETFEVTEEGAQIHNLRERLNPQRGLRLIKPGTYKRLRRNGTVVMSNTPAEISDHRDFIRYAQRCKTILINGLGLGVALKAILESDIPERIIVVEKYIDVLSLVGPSIKDDRVQFVHADAFEYKPPKGLRFDAVWHDIWDHICGDNLPEMAFLHRRYGHKTEWQGSWCKAECKRGSGWR